MIQLSYSTLNELIECPHTWLNKQMGLKRLVTSAMTEGREAHKIIQAHISGVKKDERLKDVDVIFPTVEEEDFDEKTHFVLPINDEYSIHGYLDGIDRQNKRFLEIKTSSNPWSLSKFYNLMQWRVYALSGDYKEVVFLTCTRDIQKVAKYTVFILPKHREEAMRWIEKGIAIIESGDFEPKETDNKWFCNYIDCPYCKK